jgi:hypothetical protein
MGFVGGFQTVADMRRPIPGQHMGLLGLVVAFQHLDLLGAPLFRGRAKFGRDGIRIDKLLGMARSGEYQSRNESGVPK